LRLSNGELIYAWKKVRLKSRLGSNLNLSFFPGSDNLDFFPRFKPENLLLNTARFSGSNLGSKLTGSNLTKYAGFTSKYHFTGID
jgi:hypothetical protein